MGLKGCGCRGLSMDDFEREFLISWANRLKISRHDMWFIILVFIFIEIGLISLAVLFIGILYGR